MGCLCELIVEVVHTYVCMGGSALMHMWQASIINP